MTDTERSAILRIIEGMADVPQDQVSDSGGLFYAPHSMSQNDYSDYLLCVRVEREVNKVRMMDIPWGEIHGLVRAWLKGDV